MGNVNGVENADMDTFVRAVGAPIRSNIVRSVVRKISPLKREFWESNLPKVLDKNKAKDMLDMIDFGAPVGFCGMRGTIESPNWPSTGVYSDAVNEVINSDAKEFRLIGPFSSPPFAAYNVSPFGAFQRKRSGKVRVVHDLSWPPLASVNDGISRDEYSLQYVSIDKAVEACLRLGSRPVYLAKIDLKNAFKHIVVRPADWPLLGSSWTNESGNKEYWFSSVLEFGLRSSPKIFDDFANALQKVMIKRGASPDTFRYMDDFLTIAGSEEACNASLNVMLQTCKDAGFEIQPSKVVKPCTVIEFLGIEINTELQQLRITEDRVIEIENELKRWSDKRKCSKRELLSIIGKLIFVSRVFKSGRSFVGRLIDLSKTAKCLHFKVRLNKAAREDLKWWSACLRSHNGVRMFKQDWASCDRCHVFSDASDLGIGGQFQGQYFALSYTGNLSWVSGMSINWRELFALTKAVATWSKYFRHRCVEFHVDNQVVAYCVNKVASRNPHILSLIRSLYLLCEQHDIEFKATYVNTLDNSSADSLSRLDFDRFRSLNPQANTWMTWPEYVNYDGLLI